ncbi:MAG: hypothetical protein JWM62_972 [Frankiales bacterium]|nr:hypothetical protein [Frankiales bacterium]
MRRPLLALALLAGCVAATVQTASTAGNQVEDSTAVNRSTTVTGGTLVSLSYDSSAGTITTVTPRLRGTGLLQTLTIPKPVTARFGVPTAPSVACTPGVFTLLSGLGLSGTYEATYTCNVAALLQPSDRPQPLTIAVG